MSAGIAGIDLAYLDIAVAGMTVKDIRRPHIVIRRAVKGVSNIEIALLANELQHRPRRYRARRRLRFGRRILIYPVNSDRGVGRSIIGRHNGIAVFVAVRQFINNHYLAHCRARAVNSGGRDNSHAQAHGGDNAA